MSDTLQLHNQFFHVNALHKYFISDQFLWVSLSKYMCQSGKNNKYRPSELNKQKRVFSNILFRSAVNNLVLDTNACVWNDCPLYIFNVLKIQDSIMWKCCSYGQPRAPIYIWTSQNMFKESVIETNSIDTSLLASVQVFYRNKLTLSIDYNLLVLR